MATVNRFVLAVVTAEVEECLKPEVFNNGTNKNMSCLLSQWRGCAQHIAPSKNQLGSAGNNVTRDGRSSDVVVKMFIDEKVSFFWSQL